MTILSKRTEQIKENYDNLPQLEDIYCKIAYDFALLSDEMIDNIRKSQSTKTKLKELNIKSMAEFEREFELSEEYLLIKSCNYQLKALERLMSGLRMRIDSLRADLKTINYQ
jgi:hypothetical protein